MSEAAKAINSSYLGDDIEFYGCSTDTRTLQKGNLFIALRGENFDGHNFIEQAEAKGASSLLIDKESKYELPALTSDNTKKAMGLLAKSWRSKLPVRTVAVTGSNGKTSVKEIVKSILSEAGNVHATTGNLNNDIGVPITLFALAKEHEYAVIEMGANHAGEIDWLSHIAIPDVAVITQCAPAHLEGFGSIEGVARAKAEIYGGLHQDGTAVINADDKYADFWKEISSNRKQLLFSFENKNADVYASDVNNRPEKNSIEFVLHIKNESITISMPMPGKHNVMNALSAAACCHCLNISIEMIKQGIEKMQSVSGRLQFLTGKAGSRIIDDTYNANPTSLLAAINVLNELPGKKILVLGDMGELGDTSIELHAEAGENAKLSGIDNLFTLGDLSAHASQAFADGAEHFTDISNLNNHLLSKLNPETTILIKGSRSMRMERVINAVREDT
ncbi:MAG: UDP-N-acetylmuramoyl-tripeptide--D-alanyl-D-alanine ligase [Pseudomonadota bacterium]